MSSEWTDKVLEALVGRAAVISNTCGEKKPHERAESVLRTTENTLRLLKEDHNKFKKSALGYVKADAEDNDDSEDKGRYRLALTKGQKEKDDEVRSAIDFCVKEGYKVKKENHLHFQGTSPKFVCRKDQQLSGSDCAMSLSSECTDKVLEALVERACVISEFCGKNKPSELSESDLSTKENVLYLLMKDRNKFKKAAIGYVKVDDEDNDDSESKGRYRLALTKGQQEKDDEVRSAIYFCIKEGYRPRKKRNENL